MEKREYTQPGGAEVVEFLVGDGGKRYVKRPDGTMYTCQLYRRQCLTNGGWVMGAPVQYTAQQYPYVGAWPPVCND